MNDDLDGSIEAQVQPTKTDVLNLMVTAQRLLAEGNCVAAMRTAEKAASLGIPVKEMHYMRAVCLSGVGRHEEALEAAKEELTINPNHTDALAQVEALTKALLKAPRPKVPSKERSWHTTLPRDILLTIQNSAHNYTYRGVPMIKNPFDFSIYPILLWDKKPRTIFEIGSKNGGSALWMGDMLNNYGIDGHIFSIDIVRVKEVSHPRVTFMEGNGRDLSEILSPKFILSLPRPLMVIEDADHSYETSKHVLEFFDPYLKSGEYMVIEDGIITDLSENPTYISGPHCALKEFLSEHPKEYEIDGNYCDFFGYNLTWCTNGFLKKISSGKERHQSLDSQKSPSMIDDNEFREVLRVVRPYTLLNDGRLYSLFQTAKSICEKNIIGNFVECEVDGGGSSALLAYVIKHYSRLPRKLFAFDCFSGCHRPRLHDNQNGKNTTEYGWDAGTYAAAENRVREACGKLNSEDVLTTVKGLSEETLAKMRDWVGMIAFLHLPGDAYESTRTVMQNFYSRLVTGAVFLVDNYGLSNGCRKALHEFETERNVHFKVDKIDETGVWFNKSEEFSINPLLESCLVNDFKADDPVACGVASQMSINERFQLYYVIRKLLAHFQRLIRFIDIGSYAGGSFYEVSMAFKRMGIAFQGIAIEPGGLPQFHEVLKKFSNNAIHLPLHSRDASKRLAVMLECGNKPEFILVDGDHSYQEVRQDIVDYYSLLAPGGIMMFHDYLPALDDRNREFIYAHHANTEPGVRQACHELMEKAYNLQALDLPLLYPDDPTQTQAHLPIIPGVFSTMRAYRKPEACRL